MIFHIWNDGDSSVGISGSNAALNVNVDNLDGEDRDEMIATIKEKMIESFQFIWNDGFKIHVATDAELAAEEECINSGIDFSMGNL